MGKTCENSRNDRFGNVKGGLRKFELAISTDISAKNLNSKYMSQYIHYIVICSIKPIKRTNIYLYAIVFKHNTQDMSNMCV